MHTVSFQSVLNKAARLLGLDPAVNLLANTSAALTGYINSAVAVGWDYFPWPDLETIGEFALDGSHLATEGNGLDTVLEVWDADPRTVAAARPLRWTEIGGYLEFGPGTVPATVWVRYKGAAPSYSDAAWNAASSYVAGDLALGSNGETYRCAVSNTGFNPVTTTGYWAKVEFPRFLGEYAARMALADSLTEDGQNARGDRESDNAWALLEHEMARYAISQNQRARFVVRP